MDVAVRVIPCLDVDDGRVVKGVNFENLRDAGDPVETQRPEGYAQPVFVVVAGVGADLEDVRAITERFAVFAMEIEHNDPRRRKAAIV